MDSKTRDMTPEEAMIEIADLEKLYAVCLNSEQRETVKVAIAEVEKAIPRKPIRESWCPNLCPTCNADLGGDCDDGYYENPYYEMCPVCRQRLDYGR